MVFHVEVSTAWKEQYHRIGFATVSIRPRHHKRERRVAMADGVPCVVSSSDERRGNESRRLLSLETKGFTNCHGAKEQLPTRYTGGKGEEDWAVLPESQ